MILAIENVNSYYLFTLEVIDVVDKSATMRIGSEYPLDAPYTHTTDA